LSRDKINDISHKLVASFRKAREFRLKKDPNDVRLEIVKSMTELLAMEERSTARRARKFVRRKKEIAEGTEEWDLLLRRYYAEELKKFGIDLNPMTAIVVVGSLNMDFVVAVDRLPRARRNGARSRLQNDSRWQRRESGMRRRQAGRQQNPSADGGGELATMFFCRPLESQSLSRWRRRECGSRRQNRRPPA